MKQFFLFLIASVCMLPIHAENESIPLYNTSQGNEGSSTRDNESQDNRSISLIPKASHDGNIIYITVYDPMESIQITVVDSMGNVIYEDETMGDYTFTLDSNVKGELIIYLEIGEDYYEGSFFLP